MADPPATIIQPDPDDPKGRRQKLVRPEVQLRKLMRGRAIPPIPDLKITQILRGPPSVQAKRVLLARKRRKS